MRIKKIISGGQTGADRAGLAIGVALGLEVSGHCPAGRRSEDGPIPVRYPLIETPSAGYEARTQLNVENADATLIFTYGHLTGGSLLTAAHADRIGKPYRHIDLSKRTDAEAYGDVAFFLFWEHPEVESINVAGNRESRAPGIFRRVLEILKSVLSTDKV